MSFSEWNIYGCTVIWHTAKNSSVDSRNFRKGKYIQQNNNRCIVTDEWLEGETIREDLFALFEVEKDRWSTWINIFTPIRPVINGNIMYFVPASCVMLQYNGYGQR